MLINEIYNIFSEKTTNVESVNDNPSNPDILYLITFNNSKDESKSAYVYKKHPIQADNALYEWGVYQL